MSFIARPAAIGLKNYVRSIPKKCHALNALQRIRGDSFQRLVSAMELKDHLNIRGLPVVHVMEATVEHAIIKHL